MFSYLALCLGGILQTKTSGLTNRHLSITSAAILINHIQSCLPTDVLLQLSFTHSRSVKTIDARIKLGSEYILHVVSYNLLENFTILSVYELSLSVNQNFLVTSYGGVSQSIFTSISFSKFRNKDKKGLFNFLVVHFTAHLLNRKGEHYIHLKKLINLLHCKICVFC